MITGVLVGRGAENEEELRERLADLEAAAARIRRTLEADEAGPDAPAADARTGRLVSTEAKLKQANALLAAQLESSSSGILIVDRRGKVVAHNRRFLDLWELPMETVKHRADEALLDLAQERLEDPRSFLDLVRAIYADRECERQGDLMELRSGRILSRNTYPVRLADGTVIGRVWDFSDHTERLHAEAERRKLQDQVLQAQKLESLGILAGGIAHDFNNLLGGVLGNVGLALMQIPPEHGLRHFIEEAEKAAQRAAELANQMLAYSGRGKFVDTSIDLNALIEDMSQLLESSTSKKARLELRPAVEAPRMEGDPTQIRQVVMNLVTNASDALGDDGGTVWVTTGIMDVDPGGVHTTYFLDAGRRPGRYAFVEVSDDGCGMDGATRERIFDPFFSTKETGHGLGMAAVLGIVRGHEGLIEVVSKPGRGSTFRIFFPLAAGAPGRALPDPTEERGPSSSLGAGGTVLVVDDEETIRMVAERSLTTAGFEVLMAEDGIEAVEVFRRRRQEIAAVLLDISMPKLDGIETLKELQKLRPDVKVVMSSGYNEDERLRDLGGYVAFIKKPYRPKDLADKVREVLAV